MPICFMGDKLSLPLLCFPFAAFDVDFYIMMLGTPMEIPSEFRPVCLLCGTWTTDTCSLPIYIYIYTRTCKPLMCFPFGRQIG